MSRAIRKLVKAGDVDGLVAIIRAGAGGDRIEALEGVLACMETHADRVKNSRSEISAACLPLVHDPEPMIRSHALGMVSMLRDPSAASLVVSALSDPAPSVRTTALLGVFHLQPAGGLGEVLRLLSDDDPWVRQMAAATVERVGDRSSVPLLMEAREREKDANVLEAIDQVVAILEGRHPPTPIEPLLREDE